MAVIRKLRSFFVEITDVLRADMTTGGIRFLKFDKPTEETMRRLMDSTAFMRESGDRAKLHTGSSDLGTEQGLVVLATDAQATTNAAQLSDRSLVAQPHQISTVEALANSTTEDMPTTVLSITADAGTTTRNRYQIRPLGAWLTWLISRLFKAGGTAGQVPKKVDGTDYNWIWADLDFSELSGIVPIANGGTGETTADAAINALLPSKTGNTLKVLRVNAGETGVEWATAATASPTPLFTTVLDIGPWNMNNAAAGVGITVAHGLDSTKIRRVTVWVRGDSSTTSFYPIETPLAGFVGSRYYVDVTDVNLLKAEVGGYFDNPEFNDDTSFSRGYITIECIA